MLRMTRRATRLAALAALAGAGSAWANNLNITNVTITGRDDTTAYVKFDITWENSWRYASDDNPLYFHDAAWVFFKVLPDGQTDWQHVTLVGTGTNPTDYVAGTGTPIELVVPADRVGLFVRRSGDGAGTTAVQNVKAAWDFAPHGLSKHDKVKMQAFGVELVYVAEGDFAAGSGGSSSAEFTLTTINTNNATIAPTGEGSKGGAGGGYPTGQTAPSTASWPNGYSAFYCMKYAITQGQYADFLNALTRSQQSARCAATNLNYYMSATAGGSETIQFRNTVRLSGDPGEPHPRVYTTVTPDRGCNFLSWADGAAFADWAGLRPMTELEFEKSCRGPLMPVADEFAFGKSTYTAISGLQGTDGSGTEFYTAGNLVVSGSNPDGPVRVGIFATAASSRVSAGASYWGIMELSGNLWDHVVWIGHATGRGFTGVHGDGVLTSGGDANVTAWPPAYGAGAQQRGGGWRNLNAYSRVSSRFNPANDNLNANRVTFGWRAVRSAP